VGGWVGRWVGGSVGQWVTGCVGALLAELLRFMCIGRFMGRVSILCIGSLRSVRLFDVLLSLRALLSGLAPRRTNPSLQHTRLSFTLASSDSAPHLSPAQGFVEGACHL
jgi:hypothetical protein